MRKTPVVLGVLSIIFGALVGAWSIFGLVAQSFLQNTAMDMIKGMSAMAPRRAGQPDLGELMTRMQAAIEGLKPLTMSMQVGVTLISLSLLAIGVGLYKRREWSRQASLLWGVIALLFIPFMIYVQRALQAATMGVTLEMMKANGTAMPGLGEGIASMQQTTTIIFTILFYAPFPIILLALMGRASAKNDLVH